MLRLNEIQAQLEGETQEIKNPQKRYQTTAIEVNKIVETDQPDVGTQPENILIFSTQASDEFPHRRASLAVHQANGLGADDRNINLAL